VKEFVYLVTNSMNKEQQNHVCKKELDYLATRAAALSTECRRRRRYPGKDTLSYSQSNLDSTSDTTMQCLCRWQRSPNARNLLECSHAARSRITCAHRHISVNVDVEAANRYYGEIISEPTLMGVTGSTENASE